MTGCTQWDRTFASIGLERAEFTQIVDMDQILFLARETAWRFHEDALGDLRGLMDLHDSVCKLTARLHSVHPSPVRVHW